MERIESLLHQALYIQTKRPVTKAGRKRMNDSSII